MNLEDLRFVNGVLIWAMGHVRAEETALDSLNSQGESHAHSALYDALDSAQSRVGAAIRTFNQPKLPNL